MKKKIILTSILALALTLNTAVTAAEQDLQKTNENKKAPITKNFPKLYDKAGNELKTPPKPGDEVFDKNGNKLPPPIYGHRHPQGPDLKLTDKQKAEADKIREASKAKIKPIKREIHNLKNELWEIKEDDSLSISQKQEKIVPIVKKIEVLRSQANEIRQQDMQQFEKLLTDEQKKALEKFKKTHQNHKPKHKPIPNMHHHFE